MPFYGAKEATPYIAAACGHHYKSHMGDGTYLGWLRDLFDTYRQCVSVEEVLPNVFKWRRPWVESEKSKIE